MHIYLFLYRPFVYNVLWTLYVYVIMYIKYNINYLLAEYDIWRYTVIVQIDNKQMNIGLCALP